MNKRLTLQITRQCNLRCDYCYEKNRIPDIMTLEIAGAAIERALAGLGSGDCLDLHFFGGEPLLAFDRLKEIRELAERLCRAHDTGLTRYVVTNGTLLDRGIWEYLQKHGLQVILSLDGTEAAQGVHRKFPDGRNSFGAVWAFVSTLSEAERGDIHLNLVLTPKNQEFLAESVKTLIECGFKHFSFSPDYYPDWEKSARQGLRREFEALAGVYLQSLEREIPLFFSFVEEKIRRLLRPGEFEKAACTFGKGEIAVDPLGGVFPCERMINTGAKGGFCLGNVRESHPSPMSATRPRRAPSRCRGCEIEPVCTNFCGCVNFVRSGDIDQPDPLICYFEKLFVGFARKIAERYLKSPAGTIVPNHSTGETTCTRAS